MTIEDSTISKAALPPYKTGRKLDIDTRLGSKQLSPETPRRGHRSLWDCSSVEERGFWLGNGRGGKGLERRKIKLGALHLEAQSGPQEPGCSTWDQEEWQPIHYPKNKQSHQNNNIHSGRTEKAQASSYEAREWTPSQARDWKMFVDSLQFQAELSPEIASTRT
ncbi:unnamed protein product [Pleuronectes platessa]|uniref:Uncharacterized protein n=1 Tax=Pleuronectes platessa TaxID=8262 RepID=A0A9N7Z1W1_PLEPL|nr:unnamed protein product [Pleuronectes platessa]